MDGLIWIIVIAAGLWLYSRRQAAPSPPAHGRPSSELDQRRKKAEEHILSSGDPDAMALLAQAQSDPARYSSILEHGMRGGNNTIRTALAMMAGLVIGHMIASSHTDDEITAALDDVRDELDSSAGSAHDHAESDGDDDDDDWWDDDSTTTSTQEELAFLDAGDDDAISPPYGDDGDMDDSGMGFDDIGMSDDFDADG